MERTPIVLMAASLVVALVGCGKSTEEEAENGEAAQSGANIPDGIYDGIGAVLRVSTQGQKRVYAFAHRYDRNIQGAQAPSYQIVEGSVEADVGKAPSLKMDELYPCSAQVRFVAGHVEASGQCRKIGRDSTATLQPFNLKLEPRDFGKLRERVFGSNDALDIRGANVDRVELSVAGLGRPSSGEWIYGGGAYRAHYPSAEGPDRCVVAVVFRSTTTELLYDVGGSSDAIRIEVRGQDCQGLSSGRLAAQ
jgi:hypothetical protein